MIKADSGDVERETSVPGPEDLSDTDLGLNPPTSMLYEPGPRRRFWNEERNYSAEKYFSNLL